MNRQVLDEALRRPGRIEWEVPLSLPLAENKEAERGLKTTLTPPFPLMYYIRDCCRGR